MQSREIILNDGNVGEVSYSKIDDDEVGDFTINAWVVWISIKGYLTSWHEDNNYSRFLIWT